MISIWICCLVSLKIMFYTFCFLFLFLFLVFFFVLFCFTHTTKIEGEIRLIYVFCLGLYLKLLCNIYSSIAFAFCGLSLHIFYAHQFIIRIVLSIIQELF